MIDSIDFRMSEDAPQTIEVGLFTGEDCHETVPLTKEQAIATAATLLQALAAIGVDRLDIHNAFEDALLQNPPQLDAGMPPKPDLCACDECGCTDIQATAWYELNTGEMLSDDGPSDTIWCPQCDAECGIVYVTEHKPFARAA